MCSKTGLFEHTGTGRWTCVHAPGSHKAPICPSRRTLFALFVLPQVLPCPAIPAPVRFRSFPFSRRSCHVLQSLRRYAFGPFRSPAGPAVPAAERFPPFSFPRRYWQGALARRAVACWQGPAGRYGPTALSLPLRYACGPLPFTQPRAATPSAGPCLSGFPALRAVHRCFHNILNYNNL